MSKIKVELLKTIIVIMVSGAVAYVVYRSFALFFQSMDNIHEAIETVKLVVKCT